MEQAFRKPPLREVTRIVCYFFSIYLNRVGQNHHMLVVNLENEFCLSQLHSPRAIVHLN